MTVDRRPSEVSRSFCDISRWKRAIESVSVLNVVASSRASSSSQRLPWRSAILRVRSPVAATSRITSVIAASGCAMVRATAKLSSVASSDREHRGQRQAGVDGVAATAAARCASAGSARPVRRRRPVTIAADRERARQRLVFLAVDRQPRDAGRAQASRERRVVARAAASTARIWPSMPKAMSLPVICFSCAASVSSSRKPALSVPRISWRGRSSTTGTVTTCRMPFGCGSRLRLSCPASASRIAGW